MTYKYEGDGNLEPIDPARLMVGHVVRMVQEDGRQSAFSDSVVLGIIAYPVKELRGMFPTPEHGEMCENLQQALDIAYKLRVDGRTGYLAITLARPYLYEEGGSPVMSFEKYEVDKRILDFYKVVVMSTGAYERRRLKS